MKLSTAQTNAMTELMTQTLGFNVHSNYKATHTVRLAYVGINKSTLKALQNKGLIMVSSKPSLDGQVIRHDCIDFTAAGWQWLFDNGILNDDVIADGYVINPLPPIALSLGLHPDTDWVDLVDYIRSEDKYIKLAYAKYNGDLEYILSTMDDDDLHLANLSINSLYDLADNRLFSIFQELVGDTGYNTPSEENLTLAQEKAMQRLVEKYFDMAHSEYAICNNYYVDVRYMTDVMKIQHKTLDVLIRMGYLEPRTYTSYITDKPQLTLLFTRKGWQWLFDNDMLNYYEKGN